MTKKRIYVDVHALQTVPPSCVNRDDTGSPKTAIYGGVTRARVSSQCWKKAIRMMFKDTLPLGSLGIRTKRVVDVVVDEINKIDNTKDANSLAKRILENAGLYKEKGKKDTMEEDIVVDEKAAALFFISRAQAKALAELALNDKDVVSAKPTKESKEKILSALKEHPAIDVALFGRMVATHPYLNTDACAQVAHSISTHKVYNEYDYFTAVDDLQSEDNAGAGHIGTIEYNSSTLYRYATVAVHELHKNLKEDTEEALVEFIRAFVCSMPTGKQNTFANRTLPEAVFIAIREDQPINMVGAFEKPVITRDGGYIEPSAQRLVSYAKTVYDDFGNRPKVSFVTGKLLSELGDVKPFEELLTEIKKGISNEIKSGGQ